MPNSNNSNGKILIIHANPQIGAACESMLTSAGYDVTYMAEWEPAQALLQSTLPDLLLLEDETQANGKLEQARQLREEHPFLPVLLLPGRLNAPISAAALKLGLLDFLPLPVTEEQIRAAVRQALRHARRLKEWAQPGESQRDLQTMRQRLSGLETLQRIGRKVTSTLDLEEVLTAVVTAAVDLTQAEEGSLLLLDESTGELYMRASRNFQEDFVRTFRLPAKDSLAGQVLRSGQPLFIDQDTPQKIKTAYLVYNLIYVPLVVHNRVIGVLEVDNRHSHKSFSEVHITLLSALADYAAIAVENARLYSHTTVEHHKLETLLTDIAEAVIVVDQSGRLMLVNRVAREMFGINGQEIEGKDVHQVIQHPELLEMITDQDMQTPSRSEVSLDSGRTLIAQFTPIKEVGLAVTMQDITQLKELDRIKSEFVNTVSHDLRSPLTAILGYVDLIERVGPVTAQQHDFIQRVQYSVNSITALINDLLDLGRIEAGFDARQEAVPLAAILRYTVESLHSRLQEKEQTLQLDLPDALPSVHGNPVRLRQMINNLLGNAIKYTQNGGEIRVSLHAEGGQVILQVSDNGPGIPAADQPYIFDKFYRASAVSDEVSGTGLGLAIVKSIVESHQGRIWVDSTQGKGATFTVVLPVAEAS